jgi:hypothetical protein
MNLHKEGWTLEIREELRKEEEKEQDEVGSILYITNKTRWA